MSLSFVPRYFRADMGRLRSRKVKSIQSLFRASQLGLWTVVFSIYGFSQEAALRPDPDTIRKAFESTHDGWSVDEVLLDDARREKFLGEVRLKMPSLQERQALEQLMRLRKSGKLEMKTTQRDSRDLSDVLVASEIAARHIQDLFGVHPDAILTHPEVRNEFDKVAQSVDPKASAYALRKGALRLRKSRELRPELTLRVTDWKRTIETMDLPTAKARVADFPKAHAVYIFRDKTGFLYIGQTNNLRERMTKHLNDSDRKSLARYLSEHSESDITLEIHLFASDSPAKETAVREAYESELIRSRKPRLNIAP